MKTFKRFLKMLVFSLFPLQIWSAESVSKEVNAKRAETPPAIDGIINDKCWDNAQLCGGFALLDSLKIPEDKTEFRVCYDDSNIYFVIECFDKNAAELHRKIKSGEKIKSFQDNSVEIFLNPKADRWDYYYIAIKPDGEFRSAYFYDTGLVKDFAYNIKPDLGITFGERSWTLELAVPLCDLGLDKSVRSKWLFNVTREIGVKNLSSYSSAKGSFQNSQLFVPLNNMNVETEKYCWNISKPYIKDIEPEDDGLLKIQVNSFLMNETGEFKPFVLESVLISPSKKKIGSYVLKTGLDNGFKREFSIFKGRSEESGHHSLFITLKSPDNKVLKKKTFPVCIKNRPVQIKLLNPSYRNSIFPGQDISKLKFQIKTNAGNSKIKGASLKFSLKNQEGKVIASLKDVNYDDKKNYELPIPKLLTGKYQCEAVLSAGQKPLYKDLIDINVYPPKKKGSVVWVGDDNNLYVNGRAFFPFGFWGGANNNPEKAVPDSESGINFALYGGYSPDFGIKSIAGIFSGGKQRSKLKYAPLDPYWKKALTVRVNKWKDRPDLIAYYMPDEPNGWRGSYAAIKEAYELVKTLDPYHPCYLSLSGLTDVDLWEDTCDIFGIHNYPRFAKGAAGPLKSFDVSVVSSMKKLINTVGNRKPVWYMGQVFNYSRYPNNRAPDYQEMRSQDYLAVISGAKGLDHYTYYYLYPGSQWKGTDKECNSMRFGIRSVAREFKTLSEALMKGEDISGKVNFSPKSGIYCKALKHNGKIYILCGSSGKKAKLVDFSLEKDLSIPALKVFCEDRVIEVAKGKFKDKFMPWDVHVYTTDFEIDKELKTVKDIKRDIESIMKGK